MQLDFAGLVRWLDDRVGRRVFAATQGASEDAGNTRLTIQGPLARAEGEITLIDPRPGEIAVFTVGEALLVLLEGDLVAAQAIERGPELPAMVQAAFHDLIVLVGEVPGAEPPDLVA